MNQSSKQAPRRNRQGNAKPRLFKPELFSPICSRLEFLFRHLLSYTAINCGDFFPLARAM
jgi:hypothetical protein